MATDIRYSNPIAPPDHDKGSKSGALTNDDFRRLLVTPRRTSLDNEHTEVKGDSQSTKTGSKRKDQKKHRRVSQTSSAANNEWLAKLRKEEEEREAEWAKKYRDRAKERRAEEEGTDEIVTSGYRAVAPNSDPSVVAKKRKQAIEESKFLGGDIEHTHLVKGLDYALLQKVKSEISQREKDHEEQRRLIELRKEREREKEKKLAAMSNEVTFKTKLGMNVFNTLFESKPSERNELFLTGRMAYVFELDDEFAESDIPTTLIRSRADCPSVESQTTLSTNDIVINKLTQILSYLRQGTRVNKKGKKRDKESEKKPPAQKPKPAGESIFDDVGEYVFNPNKKDAPSLTSGDSSAIEYFEKSALRDESAESSKDIHVATKKFVKAVSKKYSSSNPGMQSGLPSGWSKGETDRNASSGKSGDQPSKTTAGGFGGFSDEHYAECYPGGMEEVDATVNSDDETDFTKMDLGNRKGPVKRWDFDTEEDYSDYQSNREALPKAAFQYGVKMNDGRKTRRQGVKNEKAKLDREWQQISQILQKRKSDAIETVTKRLKSGE